MKHLLISILALLLISSSAWAQDDNYEPTGIGSGGTVFGFKGGMTLATQTWNGYQRNALLSYHGDLQVEWLGRWTQKEKGPMRRYAMQIQLGYHRKGSGFRNVFSLNGSPAPTNTFHNISLTAIGKGYFKTSAVTNLYYGLGLRLDGTVDYQLFGTGLEGVNRINYGVWLGGGLEFELKNAAPVFFIEVNISPDISQQVFVPPGIDTGLRDVNGNPIPSREQKVINLIAELSIGMKFGKGAE